MSLTETDNLCTTKKKIDVLQSLRALAFFTIFVTHAGVVDVGLWGLSIFLVLSGFLMMMSYYDIDLSVSWKDSFLFAKKKIGKLYLLHIVMMLLGIFLDFYYTEFFTLKFFALLFFELVANLFLVQAWVPSVDISFSLNGVAWFMCVSLLTYFLFPRIVRIIKKLNVKKALLLALGIFASQILFGIAVDYVSGHITFLNGLTHWATHMFPIYRLGDFCIGCCVGYCYKNVKLDNLSACKATVLEIVVLAFNILCFFAYFASNVLCGQKPIGYTVFFTWPAALLVFILTTQKGFFSKVLSNRVLIWFGNISPFAYLIHLIVIDYIKIGFIELFNIYLSPGVLTAVSFPVTIALSVLWQKCVSPRLNNLFMSKAVKS